MADQKQKPNRKPRSKWDEGTFTRLQTSFPTPPVHSSYRPPKGNGNGNGNGSKRPPGRPAKYDPDWHPRMAYDFCSKCGYTNKQLADLFGITTFGVEFWLREHEEFNRAIRNGRWDFDSGRVQKSLATRACGYDITERTFEWRTNEETGLREKVVTREVTKHIPPDPTSIIFWLCNRQKDHWRREVSHEHSGRIEAHDPALQAALKEMLKKAEPQTVNALKETLETIACANTQPL